MRVNLFAMALVLPGNYFQYYSTSIELVVGIVAFIASMIIVPINCYRKSRMGRD